MEGCVVQDLTVHGKANCYVFSPEQMQRLQDEVAVSTTLEPGINLVKIKSGAFHYQSEVGQLGEPLVLLWIYGGKVTNQKTHVPVNATWASLNGYDDVLTLDVAEPAKLCAFFFDTHLDDNEGELHLSVVRI
ncbi:MAG: hypothetical protein MUF49_14705 [Oculatellaceae cyanobacterium Prado106]|jgi:hypothetical protein|nr:hypothetical protein [Oculatellaceae cyanobacterium Prado106]